MSEGQISAVNATVERTGSRVLGDMDRYIEELDILRNNLRECNNTVFGAPPEAVGKEQAEDPHESSFVSSRNRKHEKIIDLLQEIRDQIERYQDF